MNLDGCTTLLLEPDVRDLLEKRDIREVDKAFLERMTVPVLMSH